MPTTLGRQLVPALLLLLVCSSARRVEAQDVTEVTLKGAFLFNFARFTEWPADALQPDTAVSACVLGDRAVADAFAKTVKGKQLAGRAVAVTTIAANESIPPCHLLYLSGVAEARIAEIVSTLRDTPVLTVSDSDTFTKRGGIVQIFVESGKMKFRINSRSARRARLQLSSRLLALAEVVDEDVASVAAVPFTDPSTSIGPELASRSVELFGMDWARRFTAWGRN
ncbi:MAG TPA: YfiR family protein [Vicinamibacterales bacterium]|nr:YfiR family protein [Vicinamibacterales bacterium]